MKVLIVDRVKVFQQIIAGVLLDSGIDNAFTSSGEEALQLLNSDTFQCICISYHLDDMDGVALCHQIRKIKSYRHTPIVLLTTENSPEIYRQAINAGITDIFLKEKIHELVNFIERFTQVNKPIEGRILYVEDQRSQRDYVSALFRERQLEVNAFDNAEDAWQAFLENEYNLVLTDIVLEGPVSGILLINKIRRLEGHKGETPILAITAFDDTSRRISLYHMGITDYITKPIMEEELIARVRNLISNQQVLNKEVQFREQLNSEEAIRHSQKMEALGKLTGGITHDYNNMLGIISGYTELLMGKLSDQPALLEHLQQIEKAGESAITLTRKLLAFTRKEHLAAESISLNGLVNSMLPMLKKTLTVSIELSTLLDDKLWLFCADKNDLENALLNMCINAKHAMNDSGKLTIVTTNRQLDLASSEKIALPPGEYVLLSIRDTGTGMDEETQKSVFDPFFSTKGDQGTGLGLSQVYGLVNRSHGTVTVKSEVGQGTIFNLYFPRQDTPIEPPDIQQVDSSGSSSPHSELSILVVDDEPALCALMEIHLASVGYTVHVASDAHQAIERLSNERVDIMITDVIMPGENGYELAEKVSHLYPEIKIILATGYDDDITNDEAPSNNYHYRLQKPIDRESLLTAAQQVWT